MTCEELKNKICKKEPLDSFIVLVGSKANSLFMASQYAEAIATNSGLRIRYISGLAEALYDSFNFQEDVLYILKTESFDLPIPFYAEDYNKVVVVCSKYKGDAKYAVKLPEPTKDNIIEYMEDYCGGLTAKTLEWIYDDAEGDINKIDNEMKKLTVFPAASQEYTFNILKNSGNYDSVHGLSVYSPISGVFYKNMEVIKQYLHNLYTVDAKQNSGVAISTILRDNIREVLIVQSSKTATPESTGMTKEKFYAVKNKCNKFKDKNLVEAFNFLTSIDYKLKSGQLDIPNDVLVGYILINTMRRLYGNQTC